VRIAGEHGVERIELRRDRRARGRSRLAEIDVEPTAVDEAAAAVPVVQLEGSRCGR